MTTFETARLLLQTRLDGAKTQLDRNKLGQFATPTNLATEILEYAQSLIPANQKIRFIDPAFGTGSFYSALLQVFPSQIETAIGYEIDPYYALEALSLWRDTFLQLNICDFTQATPPLNEDEKANLLICNPPYVRHHHLSRSDKVRLQNQSLHLAGVKLSQLASLYCHFLCIASTWMAEEGIAGWLIPSGFMDVNYGEQVKEYLLNSTTLLRVHRFCPSDVQFDDALVSSAVVWFKKALPPSSHTIEFTYGGSLKAPQQRTLVSSEILQKTPKWTTIQLQSKSETVISHAAKNPNNLAQHYIPQHHNPNLKQFQLKDLFSIKRGIATGANDFFILTPEQIDTHQIPTKFLKPILPSPRYLTVDEIQADNIGNPLLKQQLFLLDCNLPFSKIQTNYPTLYKYLQTGIDSGISSRYLCKHRNLWYSQENRSPAPYLCTYMGRVDTSRGKPFRFILNHSNAIVSNVYLMLYPKPVLKEALMHQPSLLKEIWQTLNNIDNEVLISSGRVYGGGLHKLEPKELGNAIIHLPPATI